MIGATQTKVAGESDQDFKQYMWNGDLLNETTVIRTGGAHDGADGGFSWAVTPHTSETEERITPLVCPWIDGWVVGDGTSKTLTVYITNDSGTDTTFDDDEVAMEVMYPSEDGDRKSGYKTTVMALLGTPAAVTTDGSTWGGGGSGNGQKLTATIAPDYSGPVRVRVLYYRNANTDTLFIDPKLEIV
jgi:hypothetical protein